MARYCYVENKITGKYYWIDKDGVYKKMGY